MRWSRFLIAAALLGALALAGSKAIHWAKERPDFAFDPMRLSLRGASPEWFEAPMARAFYATYAAMAGAPFSLLNGESLEAFALRLQEHPWVRSSSVEPVLPDRLRVSVELRRPLAAVADGSRLRLVDADGAILDLLSADAKLPTDVEARGSASASPEGSGPFGLPWIQGLGPLGIDRDAARAAASLVQEWRSEVEMLLKRALGSQVPGLVAIDVSNHGLRLAEHESEYVLVVRGVDGPVRIAWGHAPGGVYRTRIQAEQKVAILVACLRSHPGFAGLGWVDVRFPKSWRERLRAATSEAR